MDPLDRPFAPIPGGALALGHGEELGTLEVVEIGQAAKRKLLGLRQNCQAFAVAGGCRLIAIQLSRLGEKNR